jgi:hypothetical protein
LTKPRPRLAILPDASVGMRRWLVSGEHNHWYYRQVMLNNSMEMIWREHCVAVLTHWVLRHPGTRPRLWWRWDAPSPRKRLGGEGEPLVYEKTHRDDPYNFGIPRTWHFIDDNLPCYESEPAYLQRLHLFLPGEKKRVKRSDFLPVMVRGCYDDPKTYWRATVLE